MVQSSRNTSIIPMNPFFQKTLQGLRFIAPALLLALFALLAGCVTPAQNPAAASKSSSQATPGVSLEIKKMMVLAPANFYTNTSQKVGMVGSHTVQGDAQYMVNALSTKLNVAGYDTISMPEISMGVSLPQLFDQRLKMSNVTSAMVISIDKMTFKGALPTQMELSVSLYDTATKQKIWAYEGTLAANIKVEKSPSGAATTSSSNLLGEALQDVFSRFQADRFVPVKN